VRGGPIAAPVSEHLELSVDARRPDALAGATGRLETSQLDLAPIAAVVPRALVPTAGVITKADLALHAGGRVAGELQVTGGVVPLSAMVGTLRDVTAAVTLNDHGIRGRLDGTLGHGTVRLDAEATPDLAAIDLHELGFTNVSLLGGLRPSITATLMTAPHRPLVRRDGTLTGDVTVEGARITLPEHTGVPLLDPTAPSDLVLAGVPGAAAASERPTSGAPVLGARGEGAPEARGPAHPWLSVNVAFDAIQLVARDVVDSVGLGGKATLRRERPITVWAGDTVGLGGTIAIDDADVELLGRHYTVEPSTLEFTAAPIHGSRSP
jgi:hypothetical protein